MDESCTYNSLNKCHDEIPEIERVIKTHIGWAVDNKNKAALLSTVIQNEELFVFQTDSKSTIRGIDQFLSLTQDFFMSDAFRAIKTEVIDLRIHISPSLSTAWFSCILNDYNEFQGKPANWENVRWTGVLENVRGSWKIMQMHFSKAEDLVR